MRPWLDRCERVVTLLSVAAAFTMMVLTTADAVGRYVLNRPILVAYEVTTNYLMVAAVFLAMPYAYRQGANIRVTFVVERLGGRTRLIIDHVVQLLSLLYCLALVVATFQQGHHMMSTRTMFTTVELPVWPGHLAVTVGLLLTAVMMLFDLTEIRRGRPSFFREG